LFQNQFYLKLFQSDQLITSRPLNLKYYRTATHVIQAGVKFK